jgi:hypothetical protein
VNIALSLLFQSPRHRLSEDSFTCHLRSGRLQTQKPEQSGHQGLVTEPNGLRRGGRETTARGRDCHWHPEQPHATCSPSVTRKIENKRSNTYGFWVKEDTIAPGKSSRPPGSGYRYVGFPMQDWVEWMPAYGFHVGSVWPVPRTHGCLRLHQNAAGEFFTLARVGTPVYIAQTQPEARTLRARKIATVPIRQVASSFLRRPSKPIRPNI